MTVRPEHDLQWLKSQLEGLNGSSWSHLCEVVKELVRREVYHAENTQAPEGADPKPPEVLSVGSEVPDGKTLYEVAESTGHKTLLRGDRVRLLQTRDGSLSYYLLRVSDNTLHPIKCEEKYVGVYKVKSGD